MTLLFTSHLLYSTLIDWLTFKGQRFDWFAWVSNIVACADQLIHNLSLIKLCPAFAKQNAAVNASDACSLLAK